MSRKTSLTLIELMIVAAFVGISAAIVIPKFAGFVRKSWEGASKGRFGVLRSASVNSGDLEGQYQPRCCL